MSSTIPIVDGLMTAHCSDCGWRYERSLEDGDELTPDENREIAERRVRSHRYKCGASGEDWGETADVELDMTGGSADAR